ELRITSLSGPGQTADSTWHGRVSVERSGVWNGGGYIITLGESKRLGRLYLILSTPNRPRPGSYRIGPAESGSADSAWRYSAILVASDDFGSYGNGVGTISFERHWLRMTGHLRIVTARERHGTGLKPDSVLVEGEMRY